MPKTPKHITDIASRLVDDENGPHWDALTEWRAAPGDRTALALFEAVLLRGAKLHQSRSARPTGGHADA